MRSVVIDTDPGIDDALALYLALSSPEIEVVGLTTTFGNTYVDTATRNARALLEAGGRPELPVHRGASSPLAGAYRGPVPQVHGPGGLGYATRVDASAPASTMAAAEYLVQTIADRPSDLTILALGPLTNLALATRLQPDIVHHVAEVVVMGGNALCPGNATPAAEANFWHDPEAADLVLGLPWKVTMVGLDVTEQVVLPTARFDALAFRTAAATALLPDLLRWYGEYYGQANGIDGVFLHDPAAVAYMIEPELFTSEDWPIRVETQGISRGKSWPRSSVTDQLASEWDDRPDVQVCTGVDSDGVVNLFCDRLRQRARPLATS